MGKPLKGVGKAYVFEKSSDPTPLDTLRDWVNSWESSQISTDILKKWFSELADVEQDMRAIDFEEGMFRGMLNLHKKQTGQDLWAEIKKSEKTENLH